MINDLLKLTKGIVYLVLAIMCFRYSNEAGGAQKVILLAIGFLLLK